MCLCACALPPLIAQCDRQVCPHSWSLSNPIKRSLKQTRFPGADARPLLVFLLLHSLMFHTYFRLPFLGKTVSSSWLVPGFAYFLSIENCCVLGWTYCLVSSTSRLYNVPVSPHSNTSSSPSASYPGRKYSKLLILASVATFSLETPPLHQHIKHNILLSVTLTSPSWSRPLFLPWTLKNHF